MPENEERQSRLKEILLEEKKKLWLELREELFRQVGENLHSQFDIPLDLGDQGLADLLEDTEIDLADIRKEQLTQMDEAMAKLERGSYGFCENCGNEIGEERLKVAPFSVYCLECKKQIEGVAYPPNAKL